MLENMHTHTEGERVSVSVFLGGAGPVTSKVLGHSPPPLLPSLPRLLLLTPSLFRNVAYADDVTSFLCSPSFCCSAGTGSERERDLTCSIHLSFMIKALGSAVQLNRLPQRGNARCPHVMDYNSLQAKMLRTANNERAVF